MSPPNLLSATLDQLRTEIEKLTREAEASASAHPDSPIEPSVLANPGPELRRSTMFLQPPLIELPPRRDQESSSRSLVSASNVYNIMRRWNLSFSGAQGSDVKSFLTRVEEGRNHFAITDADMFGCLPFFLTGIALHWYRIERGQWRTWPEFVKACRNRFGDPDFQFALNSAILQRTQGEGEPFGDFLTCLRSMFARLDPPWHQEEQLNLVYYNMSPRLQVALHRHEFYDFVRVIS